MTTKRAALYLRVSTDEQDTGNQREALERVALQRGWTITKVYEDKGISGAKGRDKRPGLDAMLKDATRARFDVVMVWAIDRFGRSLTDLLANLQVLEASRVEAYFDQQGIDTTTPMGRMIFQVTGAFAEFERSLIVARVHAGISRAKAKGVVFGRRKVSGAIEDAIRERLEAGEGMVSIGRAVGCGTGTVQRVKAEMAAAA